MKNKLITNDQSKTVLDGDTHITVKLNSQDETIFIYLLNNKDDTCIQINERFYNIVNYENNFNDVYDCLIDYLK